MRETREDKVLHELQEAYKGKREYFVQGIKLETGWVTNYRIIDVNIGAVAGLRALRKLKELGYRYTKKRFVDKNDKPTGTVLYKLENLYPDMRLAKDPTKAVKKPFVIEDINQQVREKMKSCPDCGENKGQGMPDGMTIDEKGTHLCPCHPSYGKKKKT